MNIYLPILVTLLSDSVEPVRSRTYRGLLHSYALQKLVSTGPKYPQEFRQIIGQAPKFRTKLENAIRSQQEVNINNVENTPQIRQTVQRDNPAIKLKVDFSNYVEKS